MLFQYVKLHAKYICVYINLYLTKPLEDKSDIILYTCMLASDCILCFFFNITNLW